MSSLRYGIFADIHGNLAAFRAVLDDLQAARVDEYLCLGDVVGYGADPAACLELVRQVDPILVGGNHDWAAAGRLSLEYFNFAARAAIEWTRSALTSKDTEWLGSRNLVHVQDGITLAHGTLHDPEVFDYLLTPYDAYLSFRYLDTPVAFVGHSHVPVTFVDGNQVTCVAEEEIDFGAPRVIANVGSVGQPRDENPDAAYGIYDADTRKLSIKRVQYDVEASVARIDAVGLPPILGERLRLGR